MLSEDFEIFALACSEFSLDPAEVLQVDSPVERYDLTITTYIAARRAKFRENLAMVDLQARRTIEYLNQWWSGDAVTPLLPDEEPTQSSKQLSTQAEIDAML